MEALPFWSEGPIPPAYLQTHFVGRQDEAERLAKRWAQRAPARTILVSPARGGRRSLLNASLAIDDIQATVVRIRVDRLLPETPRGFVSACLEATHAVAPHPSLPRLQRLVRLGPPEALVEALDGWPEALARTPARALVVLEGADRLSALSREVLAALDQVVATSRAHFVTTMTQVPVELQERLPALLGPEGVRITRLVPLSRKEAGLFLRDRFAAVRCQATPEALALMLEYTGGDPASVQLLGARCHEVLLRAGKGRLDEGDVAEGLFRALESLPPEWTRILGELSGRARDAFVAVALGGNPSISEVGRRIGLDGKNVSVLLSRLVDRGAPIEKTGRGRYRVTHRLLAEWIRKEWTVVSMA